MARHCGPLEFVIDSVWNSWLNTYMSNDETFPGTITTIDQNTHRPITWTVLAAWTRTGGYTHTLTIQRPTGRKAYIMNVQMVDGAIAKHDRAESLMGRF